MNIIPKPKSIQLQKEFIKFTGKLFIDEKLKSERINIIDVFPAYETDTIEEANIAVVYNERISSKEGYKVIIKNGGIIIEANSCPGVFYSLQTLKQIVSVNELEITIPKGTISDEPRFTWRGAMMDVSRHYFSVDFIKKYLKTLSLHKINKFHWHLTDDQGWRIEIKKYPQLTEIGSKRPSNTVNHGPYGNFYTQDEIKEVINYASNLHIEVIPEIDVPGHATAAIASIKDLSCIDEELKVATKWGIHDKTLCAGKDSVFVWLENVLKEVAELFPSQFIHLGGDEAKKNYWENCPNCKKRMNDEGLSTLEELQSYFIKRTSDIIKSLGKKVLGWDEILEGGLAEGATVFSWQGVEAGIECANKGHDVIMCPTKSACYFDHRHIDDLNEPGRLGVCTVKNAWDFNPIQPGISKDSEKHILGLQGNIWTEGIEFPYMFEYLAFPRMTALSETMWFGTENKNWEDFKDRLTTFKDFLRKNRINFYDGVLE